MRASRCINSIQSCGSKFLVHPFSIPCPVGIENQDLHFWAHPTLALEFGESYAGDTFIRCLPEKKAHHAKGYKGRHPHGIFGERPGAEEPGLQHKTGIRLPFGSSTVLCSGHSLGHSEAKESLGKEEPVDG